MDQNQINQAAPAPSEPPARARLGAGALLWASAFILLGLLVVQGGRVASHWSNAAKGDVVSRVGEFTMLTVAAQNSEDVLLVLDGRGDAIYAYRIQNQKAVELLRRYELSGLFAAGQRIGAGRVNRP